MPMPASDMLCVISDLINRVNCHNIEDEYLDCIINKMVREYDCGSYRMAMRIYGITYHNMRILEKKQ